MTFFRLWNTKIFWKNVYYLSIYLSIYLSYLSIYLLSIIYLSIIYIKFQIMFYCVVSCIIYIFLTYHNTNCSLIEIGMPNEIHDFEN